MAPVELKISGLWSPLTAESKRFGPLPDIYKDFPAFPLSFCPWTFQDPKRRNVSAPLSFLLSLSRDSTELVVWLSLKLLSSKSGFRGRLAFLSTISLSLLSFRIAASAVLFWLLGWYIRGLTDYLSAINGLSLNLHNSWIFDWSMSTVLLFYCFFFGWKMFWRKRRWNCEMKMWAWRIFKPIQEIALLHFPVWAIARALGSFFFPNLWRRLLRKIAVQNYWRRFSWSDNEFCFKRQMDWSSLEK